MSNVLPSHSGITLSPRYTETIPPAPRWRWTLPLIALTTLLALTAIVLEIVFLKSSHRPSETAAYEQRDPLSTSDVQPIAPPSAAPTAVSPVSPQATVSPPQNSPAIDKTPAPTLTPAPLTPKPPPAPSPELPLPAPSQEILLEALGGLTAAHLYQTYLNIGLLADGVEGEIYSPADARKMLATVIGLVDTVDKQLARLPEESLKVEERKAMLRIRSLTVLLRTQIKEVQAYWETNDKEHAKRFHKARAEAWTGLKELLDLKD